MQDVMEEEDPVAVIPAEDPAVSSVDLVEKSEGIEGLVLMEEEEEEEGEAEEADEAEKAYSSQEESVTDRGSPFGTDEGYSDEAEYDTELENEDSEDVYDPTGSRLYMDTSRRLGVVPVSYVVRHMSEESLVMKHHGLGPLGAKAMALPLASNTHIIHLDLEDNGLDSEGAVYLANMLKENCYISYLRVSENRLGSRGAAAMCDMLLANNSISTLDLSGNDFQDKDGVLFAAAILENGRVHTLNLSHNSFGYMTGEPMGHAIGENEILEKLDLSWNHFRGGSGVAILDGIKVNSRLKWVNLSWNGLGDDSTAALLDCLKQNHVLLELDISNNRISTASAAALAKGLDANETLKVFKVGRNPISAVGALMLVHAINNERSLIHHMDLTDICVDKEFSEIYKEMQQSRDITIKHGGVLSDYVIKGSPKKPMFGDGGEGVELTEEEKTAFTALEEFLKNDPMAILNIYVKKRGLRLLDLFNQFDKDKNFKVSKEEFKDGVHCANIGLEDGQVDSLVDRLEQGDVKDGMIDYSELVFGSRRTNLKQRHLSKALAEVKAASGNSGTTPRTSSTTPRTSSTWNQT